MGTETFGIGIVSCGFITTDAHVPSVEYLREVEIAGLQNRTESTAEELADRCRAEDWGDPTVFGEDEVSAMVADPAVDGLWVTSPNFLRESVIGAAIDAVEDGAELQGIAMEKPVARTLSEARGIIDRIDSAGIPHAYLENWPHEPNIDQMHQLLWDRGRVAGRPYIARSRAEHGGPHSAWFWDGSLQGGGALTDMLCHSLAGNHILLSDPDQQQIDLTPVRVSADTGTLKWARDTYADALLDEHGVDYRENPADDYARTTVEYESPEGEPIVSEATGSWCFVGSGVARSIELLGPEYSGRVVTDDSASSIFLSDSLTDGEGWAEKQNATSGRMPVGGAKPVTSGYVAENRDAVEAFRAGECGRMDLEFGYDILELCMAAYKAAEEERHVNPQDEDLTDYVPVPAR